MQNTFEPDRRPNEKSTDAHQSVFSTSLGCPWHDGRPVRTVKLFLADAPNFNCYALRSGEGCLLEWLRRRSIVA